MRKVVVNPKHKKIDASRLGKPLSRIASGALAGGMAIFMYSGAIASSIKASADDTKAFDFGNTMVMYLEQDSIKETDGPQDIDDARTFDGDLALYFYGIDDYDLSDLEYFGNLHGINFNFKTPANVFSVFDNVPIMPSVESVEFRLTYASEISDAQIAKLKEKFPNLKSLDLGDGIIGPTFAREMTGLEELKMHPSDNCDMEFSELTYLKKFKITSKPYTIPVYFNTEEYNTLCNAGVDVEFSSESDKETYLEVTKKIDEMVSSLGVTKDSTDKEKLDAILIYVMEHYDYDSEISSLIEADKITEAQRASEVFYKEGTLYAVFNKPEIICGNYSALVEAMFDRLSDSTKSFIMSSNTHAWNLVNVGGELYCVDSTWLDEEVVSFQKMEEVTSKNGLMTTTTYRVGEMSSIEAIKKGETEDLRWYMILQEEFVPDKSHTPNIVIPSYMYSKTQAAEIESRQELDSMLVDESSQSEVKNTVENSSSEKQDQKVDGVVLEDSSNMEVEVNVNGKVIVTTMGALVGVLAGAGLAVHVARKKKKEKNAPVQQVTQTYGDPMQQFGSYDPFATTPDQFGYDPYATPDQSSGYDPYATPDQSSGYDPYATPDQSSSYDSYASDQSSGYDSDFNSFNF